MDGIKYPAVAIYTKIPPTNTIDVFHSPAGSYYFKIESYLTYGIFNFYGEIKIFAPYYQHGKIEVLNDIGGTVDGFECFYLPPQILTTT